MKTEASSAWLTFLKKFIHKTMSSWELQWYTSEKRRKMAERDLPALTHCHTHWLTACAGDGHNAASIFLSYFAMRGWIEGSIRGSGTILLLQCQEENQRSPAGIGLTWKEQGVHLWCYRIPQWFPAPKFSGSMKPCTESWVGFFKEFDIVLTLLKSNTMGEIPDFKRSGRRPKHSTSEVSNQTLLRLFSYISAPQAKILPRLQIHGSSIMSLPFENLALEDGKGVWERIYHLTWFTYSLQPTKATTRPLQAISFFKIFHSYSRVQVPGGFSVPGVSSRYRNKVKRKVSTGCHSFKDLCITSLFEGSLHNKSIKHFFAVDRGTAIWIPGNNNNNK